MGRDSELDDIELVLVDGDNLLHAVRGSRDEGGVAWLLPRLSGWRPEGVRIVVGLDGHAAPGEQSRGRVTRGIEFHHSGHRTGDDMLMGLLASRTYAERARTVVITRDRELQTRARGAGGQTRSVEWFMRQVNAPGAGRAAKPTSIGAGKPPPTRQLDMPEPGEAAAAGWRPGRGATQKTGNPKRKAKHLRRR